MRTMRVHAVVVAMIVAGCAKQAEPPAASETAAEARAPDAARVRELEQQARALAKTDGCERADQCASAPLGAKACGGPRTYLVYCKATTDEAALLRALEELKRAEEAYNKAAGLASDCMMVMPPALRVEGRSCVASNTR